MPTPPTTHIPPTRARPSPAARLIALCGCGLALAAGLPARAGAQNQPDAEPVPAQPDAAPPGPTTTIPGPARPAPEPDTERYEDRLIREVRIRGLTKVDEQAVLNQIRSKAGQPLSGETVRSDVRQLTRLGRFSRIDARFQVLEDQSVVLTYEFVETPIIEDVQVAGNRQISDGDIGAEVSLLKGTAVDEYQLAAAARRIQDLYRSKGYYQSQVTIDQKELNERGIVLFRISEGERVKVTSITFEGNSVFSTRELRGEIKTEEQGLFETGPVDDQLLDQDVASLITFYKDRGYLDVRADRRVTFSPNAREAIVTFVIEEGPLYTLRSVKAVVPDEEGKRSEQPPSVYTAAQIAGLMNIKPGDVYSVDKIRRSVDAVRNGYLQQGYVDVKVQRLELRDETEPQVDLLLVIDEGRRFKTGLVTIVGNELTDQKVIRRHIDIYPGQPLNASVERRGDRYLTLTERRLNEPRLFEPGSVKMTIQPEDPENPGFRDVLLELRETNTASLSFGVAAGSDGGLNGIINLNQRNFDITDTPDTVGELFSGEAFRGGGQIFNIAIQPGTENSLYSISLTDPYLFETDYTGSILGQYSQQEREQYDEDRLTGRLSLGRRFGERWVGTLSSRWENVNIRNIEEDAPTDVFDVKGDNPISGLGLSLARTTVDSRFRPTEGARTELGYELVGAVGGDYEFNRFSAEHQVFLPIEEDLLGLRSVLSLKTGARYIPEGPDDAPIFERFYLGGRSLRGFDFRTVSPKGIRNDTGGETTDPVGGTWSFFAGIEYEKPVFKDFIAVVLFIDSGTVTNDVGFDDYRISAGFGIRLYVEALSPAPFAFDFGFPINKIYLDEEKVFSFSVDLPF